MVLTTPAQPGAPNQKTSASEPRQVPASGSAAVRALISGPVYPAELLAVFPTAAYVRLRGGRVIAVLTSDAVRLPCGLVLAASSSQQPLAGLGGPVLTGAAQVRIGALTVEISRVLQVAAPSGLTPDASAVAGASARLTDLGFDEHGRGLRERLRAGCHDPRAARSLARSLVGAGSGLTPSGDDVLAGFLVGARTFGVSADPLRVAVQAHAPGATTDLSATLLRHATGGESIPQVDSLLGQLTPAWTAVRLDLAVRQLLEVGHSSGIALATGVIAAAESSPRVADGSARRIPWHAPASYYGH